MGSTFLDLTNRVIRRINEVELTETSFAAARGIQAVVKDSVQDSINEINQQKWNWPYHTMDGSQVLTIGQNEYLWPADFKSADWQSFQLEADPALNSNNTTLTQIDTDEWYQYLRDLDDNNAPNGRMEPRYVFNNPKGGFGVTPSPNQAYTVSYTYWKRPEQLTLFSDTTDIPVEFNNVILFGALYHMNLFRENPEGVSIARTRFEKSVVDMYQILVEQSPYVHDTRANFGGSPFFAGPGGYHL